MHRGICKVDIDRKIASQVQESMHLYTSFSLSELCPWTEFQTKTYSTAIILSMSSLNGSSKGDVLF